MRVPLLDLRAQYAAIRAEIEPVLLQLCEAQGFILGPEVERLESELAARVRAPHAVACASGTDALLLALMVCGVGPGDEVMTSAFSFIAGAEAVALRGARPVFVDIEPDTFNIDPDAVERAITRRTRAILPVDLFGQCADLTALLDIADRHHLPVIEDAAQSIGAEHRGRRAGEMAAFTTFSFYPTKNLGGFGDGGMVTALDAGAAHALRELHVHGESERYVHVRIGTNSRLDALQAAVLRVKLRHLDRWTEQRQLHAAEYTRLLRERDLDAVVRPPVVSAATTRHVYNQYTVRTESRDALRAHLEKRGVGTGVYYPLPLHQQPCFRGLVEGTDRLPQSEAAAAQVLSLPVYPELTAEQRAYVVDCIAEFFGR